MSRHYYTQVDPRSRLPFKKLKRYTIGTYVGVTKPAGLFGFRYAVFMNRKSELLIPLHDLAAETKKSIDLKKVLEDDLDGAKPIELPKRRRT